MGAILNAGTEAQKAALLPGIASGEVVGTLAWVEDSGRWEADIIAADGDALVLCEVKTRTTAAFGLPEEAITAAKATRLRRLAAAWLQQCDRDELSTPVVQVRIDVVAVQVRRRGAPQVRHLIGVC